MVRQDFIFNETNQLIGLWMPGNNTSILENIGVITVATQCIAIPVKKSTVVIIIGVIVAVCVVVCCCVTLIAIVGGIFYYVKQNKE